MNIFFGFFKLIRWPNLVFIVLTQVFFYFFIITPIYKEGVPFGTGILTLICLCSLFIAAAGYIINDYFDLNIDLVNKPERLIIGNVISRRWAILFHIILSILGIVISLYISLRSNFIILFGNILSVLLLWLYSTTFKKKLLIGNIVISLLTAWVIIIVFLALNKSFIFYSPNNLKLHRVFRFEILYASFAFIISLVREVIKDIEDIEGDSKYGCQTMPIVWGIPVSKVFCAVWIVVLAGALIALQFYILQLGWWIFSIYTFIFVILPLIKILVDLYNAGMIADYTRLSSLVKLVMFTGIMCMILLRLYL